MKKLLLIIIMILVLSVCERLNGQALSELPAVTDVLDSDLFLMQTDSSGYKVWRKMTGIILRSYLIDLTDTSKYVEFSDSSSQWYKRGYLDALLTYKLNKTDTSVFISDALVNALLAYKLSLSGGTMSGSVNAGDNDFTNIDDADIDKLDFGTVKTGIVSIDLDASQNINWASGSSFRDTVGNAVNPENIVFSNMTDGQWITLELYSSGLNSIGWGDIILWLGGVAPINLTEDKTDIFQFYRSGTNIFGTAMQGFK